MVTQKGAPSLAWRPTRLGHVFDDTRLRDLKPQPKQLAVNAWRTPKRILHAHLPYQHTQLCLNLRAPSPRVRFPTPIATKAGPVPPHERLRPDDCENLQDCWKPAIQLVKNRRSLFVSRTRPCSLR